MAPSNVGNLWREAVKGAVAHQGLPMLPGVIYACPILDCAVACFRRRQQPRLALAVGALASSLAVGALVVGVLAFLLAFPVSSGPGSALGVAALAVGAVAVEALASPFAVVALAVGALAFPLAFP
eukprot:2406378-Pyramimonas_sp.AAC.1